MFVKSRVRAVVFPLAFYLALGSACGYLVWAASHGARGLKAKAEYDQEMSTLQTRLAALDFERASWERKVRSMRSEAVEKDLLDEEARKVLGRAGKNEVVMFIDKPAR